MPGEPLRLVQTGDLHLLANPSWPPALRALREARLRGAIGEIIRTAAGADFLVLAGDVIDGTHWTEVDLDARLGWFADALGTVGRERVIHAFGSHDQAAARTWLARRAAPRVTVT